MMVWPLTVALLSERFLSSSISISSSFSIRTLACAAEARIEAEDEIEDEHEKPSGGEPPLSRVVLGI